MEIDICYGQNTIYNALILCHRALPPPEDHDANASFIALEIRGPEGSFPVEWLGKYVIQLEFGGHASPTLQAAIAAIGGQWRGALQFGGPAIVTFPVIIEHITPEGQDKIVAALKAQGLKVEYVEPVYREAFSARGDDE